jgi:phosphopantothenoylcysteine decarboxylase/phosphopantothenate--cysteine ligase
MKTLITSGGCKVPIDDVRHIGNFSSGRHGIEIAKGFTDHTDEVVLFREKGSAYFDEDWRDLNNADDVFTYLEYKDYDEYLGVKDIIAKWQPDVIISAAAISDYIMDKTEGKISSEGDELVIRLRKGEKVIQSFRALAPNAIIVGFKLLVSPTDDEKFAAINKVFNSGVDYVVYNDLTELRKGNPQRYVYRRDPLGVVILAGVLQRGWELANIVEDKFKGKIL